jgi:uncharacterized protein
MIASNSSPLIALGQIGRLDLLPALFGSVLVPQAVIDETRASVGSRPWLRQTRLTQPIPESIALARLDRGEQEALALAIERDHLPIILDDLDARRVAERLHLPMTGTLGVLVVAKRRGLLRSLRTEIEALQSVRFFIGERIIERVLSDAGED